MNKRIIHTIKGRGRVPCPLYFPPSSTTFFPLTPSQSPDPGAAKNVHLRIKNDDQKILDCVNCGKDTVHEWDEDFRCYICQCGQIWDGWVETETERISRMREHICQK